MTAYLIADVKITDTSWLKYYFENVPSIVHKNGGKYLSRGGKLINIEGEKLDTSGLALLSFPSTQAIHDFMNDPEYAQYKAARNAGSVSRFHILEGRDASGAVDYLDK